MWSPIMRGQSIPIGGEFAEGQGNKYKRPKTVKKRDFWRIVRWLLEFEIKLTHIVTYKQTNVRSKRQRPR